MINLWAVKSKCETDIYVQSPNDEGTRVTCTQCNKEFEENECIIHCNIYQRSYGESMFCLNCAKRLKPEFKAWTKEVRLATVTEHIPGDAYRILERATIEDSKSTAVINGVRHEFDTSQFDAASMESVQTIDRVWRSKLPEYNFDDTMRIGPSPLNESLLLDEEENREKAVDDDPLAFLVSCRDATPILPGAEEREQLEDKSAER